MKVSPNILSGPHLRELVSNLRKGLIERAAGTQISDGGETHTKTKAGLLLSYAASVDYLDAMGGKILATIDANPTAARPFISATTVLLRMSDGEVLAVLDGGLLTAVRTACVSGVAVTLLAGPQRLAFGVVGTGLQATTHLLTLHHLGFGPAYVVGRDFERSSEFALTLGHRHGVFAEPLQSINELLEASNVVITATRATTPLFSASDLPPGRLLVVIGMFEPEHWEVEDEIARSMRLVVDSREKFLRSWTRLAQPTVEELGDLLVNARDWNRHQTDAMFKPMGMGMFDIIAAHYVWEQGLLESP